VAIEPSKNFGNRDSFQKQLATRVFASCLLPFSLDNRLAVVILQRTATTTRSIQRSENPLCHAIVPAPILGTHRPHLGQRDTAGAVAIAVLSSDLAVNRRAARAFSL
jgi:hypothetical protein